MESTIGFMHTLIEQIQSGYFSNKAMNDDILKQTKGRGWGECISS